MTPKEVVLANVAFAGAERPAFDFSGGRRCDFCHAGIPSPKNAAHREWKEKGYEFYTDAWGNVWHRIEGMSKGGEIFKPVLEDWRSLDTLTVPAYDDPALYAGMREAYTKAGDRFRMAFMPIWVFATSRYLRKMEIYFMDLIEYREEIDRLHGIVAGLAERMIHRMADAGAEGFLFCEDLGVQDRTLVSPAMWRDVFRPHYLRLTGAAHERGMKVFMHSCGYNWALIDDLIEAGIDCFQFDQPAAYDMPALAAKLKAAGRGLYAPVDIQKVLPTGNREFIVSESKRLARTFKGGLIVKNYGDLKGIGVEPEWDQLAYETLLAESATGA